MTATVAVLTAELVPAIAIAASDAGTSTMDLAVPPASASAGLDVTSFTADHWISGHQSATGA